MALPEGLIPVEPFAFELRLADFSLDLLPVDRALLESDPALLRQAVHAYFEAHFRKLGGEARITCTDDTVSVVWIPVAPSDTDRMLHMAVGLLRKGAYDVAAPLLGALAERCPESFDVHYNYGMMLSDQGKLDEAIGHLRKAVALKPEAAEAWNALGTAHHRQGDRGEAQKALEESLRLDPESGHTLRNLGGLLADASPERGLTCLRKAALLLPQDQGTQYGYGLCLARTGQIQEADRILHAAIELAPYTEMAENCRQTLTRMSHDTMRAKVDGALRNDVVSYCLAAMEAVQSMGVQRFRAVTLEIAVLGRDGLDINDPTPKYTLKSLPGQFSGMQLVSYMYVGFKHIAPDHDAGIDLSREYDAARLLFDGKQPS